MDFTLRCNSLKCRAQLTERAVVTTCSHIFCNICSDTLGLTAPPGGNRGCPACHSVLPNPDDAVSTSLNPTEDYKTSVLSGLAPSIIMECAGRGLAFWSYQLTQEIVYQEYLAKTLTDKYGNLNVQMDKMINDANSELEILNQRLTNMQMEQDRLKTENQSLVAAFREKSRKHQQTQELYDRLKRKEMTAATQSAAFDSVDDVLGSVSGRNAVNHHANQHHRSPPRAQVSHNLQAYPSEPYGHMHHRSASGNSHGVGGLLPTSHSRRMGGFESNTFGSANKEPTSISHRTQLVSSGPTSGHPGVAGSRRSPQHYTPIQQQPFSNPNSNSTPRNNVSGYGMSAGMKIGRQQGSRSVNTNHFDKIREQLPPPVSQVSQQISRGSNTYY